MASPPGGTPIAPSILARATASVGGAVIGALGGAIRGARDAWFGPLQPLQPVAPAETKGRKFDFPIGANIQYEPRREYGQELIGFDVLRRLAEPTQGGLALLRLVIETRKDQLAGQPWKIQGRDGTDGGKRARDVEQAMRRPDRVNTFLNWQRMLVEDVLTIDAPTVYLRPMSFGAKLPEVVDGATIKPLIGGDGRTPLPPDAAYQQILHGVPGQLFTLDELVYAKRNARSHKIYGMCYSADTEVLTRRGWLRFADVTLDDEVATRNQQTKRFEWQRPTHLINEPYSGEMVHFRSRSVDLLVTPKHRMLVTARPRALGGVSRHSGEETLIPAGDLAPHLNHEIKIPVTSEWAGGEIGERTFALEASRERDDKHLTAGARRAVRAMLAARERPVTVSGDDFCALLGAYLAEGNVRAQGGIEIAQMPQSKGFGPYGALLARVSGGPAQHNGRAFVLPRRGITDYFRQFGHAHEKFIPQEIMDATPRQIRIFWDHFMLGDGSYEPSQNRSRRGSAPSRRERIVTTSRRMADQLVELAQKLGVSASVRERPAGRVTIEGRECSTRPSYCVSVRYSRAMAVQTERVSYEGTKHCVTVPNGVIYVRRNGKPAWCGNSPVEQVITIVNLALRRELWQLEGYTEGTRPEALVAVPETWNQEQLNLFQISWDAMMSGDQARLRKIKWVPGGAKPMQLERAKDLHEEFDDWLARVICYCFSVSAQALIKMMNRATAETAKESALEEGLEPLKMWWKDLFDEVLEKGFGAPDLEFAYEDEEISDPTVKVNVISTLAGKKPIITQDEARKAYRFPAMTAEQREELNPAPPPAIEEGEQGAEGAEPGTAGAKKPPAKGTGEAGEGKGAAAGGKPEKPAKPEKTEKAKKRGPPPIDRERKSVLKCRRVIEREVASVLRGQLKTARAWAEGELAVAKALGAGADTIAKERAHKPPIDSPETDGLDATLQAYLEEMAQDGAEIALRQVDADLDAMLSLANKKAIAWAEKRAAELVTKIDETTRENLRAAVADALNRGVSIDEFAKELSDSYWFSKERARLIAVTETAYADVQGNVIGWRESGVVKRRRWLTSKEPNVCEDCLALDGVEVGIDEEFDDGDPPAHPGCHCDVVPVTALADADDADE